jgi:eukaryotic-like serine/threonine-protein kinase
VRSPGLAGRGGGVMASFGKYRIVAELAKGGMADVFLALSTGPAGANFGKLAVVKHVRGDLAEEPEFIKMFSDEARIALLLNHPNVVQTFDVGWGGANSFLAMEYLEGQPFSRLRTRLTSSGDAAVKDLQYLTLLDALAGLHSAHELCDFDGTPLDVVHRDVTPQNVFVTYDGQVKVLDFGIAKAAGRASETKQGLIKGKLRYMAPEQLTGGVVDRRADVFSVGVMLWEAAVGRSMWQGANDVVVMLSLRAGELRPPPRSVDPTVPEPVDAMCRKAMALSSDERYATAEAFRADLEQFLAERGLLADGRRRLGATTAELFREERAALRATLEQRLSALRSAQGGDPTPVMFSSPTPSVGARAPRPASASRVRGRALGRWRGAAGLAVAVGATSAAWLVRRSPHEHRATTAAVERAPKHDLVRLRLNVVPPSAAVRLDGELVPSSYEAEVPRGVAPRRLRAEAPGFEPQSHEVRFDESSTFNITLAAIAKGNAPAAKPPPTAPAPAARRAPVAPVRASAASPPPAAVPEAPAAGAPPSKSKAELDAGDPWRGPGRGPKGELDQADPWRH